MIKRTKPGFKVMFCSFLTRRAFISFSFLFRAAATVIHDHIKVGEKPKA